MRKIGTSFNVLHRSFYETYQYLGFIGKISMLWLLFSIPFITIGIASSGLIYSIKCLVDGKDVSINHFFDGIKKYWKASFVLTLIYFIFIVPGVLYFLALLSFPPLWSKVLGMFVFYLLILVNVLCLYLFPLMVEQNITNIPVLFKQSFRLIVENFNFSINIFIYILVITFLIILFPLLLFIWAGFVGMITYYSLLSLFSKYNPEKYNTILEVNWKGTFKPWES